MGGEHVLTRRQLMTGLLALGAAGSIRQGTRLAAAVDGTPAAGGELAAILDGTTPVDAQALADLARERTRLGAAWLTEAQRPTGAFYYVYDPVGDEYDIENYNEVRHAGTTYALFQAYGLLADETVLATAEQASEYIRQSLVPVKGAGLAYLDFQNGDTSLGGQALALVALLERRRVTGNTDADELIQEMGTFLLWMEIEDHQGRFYNSYQHRGREKLLTPDVVFYPGESLLALTRLAEQFPDGPYLGVARRAANYLVYERDGDIPALGSVPREDHWLTIALSELYRLAPENGYATVAYLQAESMIANQYTAEDGDPDNIGGARRDGPISYTSTATKGEAIVAAWGLAQFVADEEEAVRFALGAQRNSQFQMRVQYTADNTRGFVRPDLMVGGWAASAENPIIRIDYVQHNLSVLVGLWHLTIEGDLPIATPLTDSSR
jgi:hypothetical protein